MLNDKVKYIITGALAGVANGLFGSGGGLFLVPLFVSWLHMEQKKAFATSVAVILPLSVASLAVFLLKGGMDWGLAWPYLLGGVAEITAETPAGPLHLIPYYAWDNREAGRRKVWIDEK